MTTEIGIGFSKETNTSKAAQEALLKAKNQLGSSKKADIAVIFHTIHYAPSEFLPVFYKELGLTKIIGASSAAIILADTIATRGISILLVASDTIRFGIGSVANIKTQDTYTAGTVLAKNTINDFGQHGRQVFIFFPDGLIENSSPLIKGIQDVFGNVFPIVGAGSCDDFRFVKSYQIFRNKALENSACGMLIGGHVTVGVAGRHGWRPLGKPRVITQVEGPIIRSIDGKKASFIYEEYLGRESEHLLSAPLGKLAILYPLGIYVEGSKEYLLRNAVDILSDGSIVCQGDIPQRAHVHIMIGNKDSCKQSALQAAETAHKNLLGKEAKLIFVFDSMARLKMLGRSASEEIEKIKEVFGPSASLYGMYCYGEIFPFQTIENVQKPHLQNESIVIAALG